MRRFAQRDNLRTADQVVQHRKVFRAAAVGIAGPQRIDIFLQRTLLGPGQHALRRGNQRIDKRHAVNRNTKIVEPRRSFAHEDSGNDQFRRIAQMRPDGQLRPVGSPLHRRRGPVIGRVPVRIVVAADPDTGQCPIEAFGPNPARQAHIPPGSIGRQLLVEKRIFPGKRVLPLDFQACPAVVKARRIGRQVVTRSISIPPEMSRSIAKTVFEIKIITGHSARRKSFRQTGSQCRRREQGN